MAFFTGMTCTGDTYLSGQTNEITGKLYLEGYRAYSINELYPHGAVYMNIYNYMPDAIKALPGWSSVTTTTFAGKTVYVWFRTDLDTGARE